jgi:hypothetical protein
MRRAAHRAKIRLAVFRKTQQLYIINFIYTHTLTISKSTTSLLYYASKTEYIQSRLAETDFLRQSLVVVLGRRPFS